MTRGAGICLRQRSQTAAGADKGRLEEMQDIAGITDFCRKKFCTIEAAAPEGMSAT